MSYGRRADAASYGLGATAIRARGLMRWPIHDTDPRFRWEQSRAPELHFWASPSEEGRFFSLDKDFERLLTRRILISLG